MNRGNLSRAIPAMSICLMGWVTLAQGSFVDKTSELGLEISSGHVAFIDYDNDGWVDIYSSGKLWKNNHGQGFAKVFDKGGNAVCADFDNDGYSDIFCYGGQQLFWNDHGKGFVLREFPKCSIPSSQGASWADYNGDGFVDLYIGGYENWNEGKTYPDMLFFNRQGKSWKKIFSDDRYRARGVTSCDFDQDGDIDIYVSNYRLQPNLLWRNDGTGKLVDVAVSHNALATWDGFAGGHSIGAAWGDFDNDGYVDINGGAKVSHVAAD